MSSRDLWTSRLGHFASAGAAVGLGAIWKFPYMAGQRRLGLYHPLHSVFALRDDVFTVS